MLKKSVYVRRKNLCTLNKAHKHFAISTNGLVWQLLEKKDRSKHDEGLKLLKNPCW